MFEISFNNVHGQLMVVEILGHKMIVLAKDLSLRVKANQLSSRVWVCISPLRVSANILTNILNRCVCY